MAGGRLWSQTAIAYQGQGRHACSHCGRTGDGTADWKTPGRALQWGKWAVAVAVIVPLIYCTTRWAFALGIPLGINPKTLHDLDHEFPGVWWVGAAIAMLGFGGALLTLGLVQRWGEIFPRWMLFLA